MADTSAQTSAPPATDLASRDEVNSEDDKKQADNENGQPDQKRSKKDESTEDEDDESSKDEDDESSKDEEDESTKDEETDSLNKELCKELTRVFKPLGVVAFSRCCRMGCAGTYDEDPDFEARDKGIYFIRLHLDGMNYNQKPKDCYAMYDDFEYTMSNWDKELELLTRFCRIVYGDEKNGTNSRFRIEKPDNKNKAVGIFFFDPLNLDPCRIIDE